MESKQRKLKNNLFISGTALISVALLDVIKVILYFILDPAQRYVLKEVIMQNQISEGALIGMIVGILALEVALSFFIGLSARAVAKGKTKNALYIVVAIIFAIVLFAGCIFYFIDLFLSEITLLSVIEVVVSNVFSAVVIYCLFDICICSLKIRKVNGQNGNVDTKDINADEGVLF